MIANDWSESKHEASRDRWLLSYADLLTLLLAFFVVMYSVSAVNENKLAELSSSLADSFNQPVQAKPGELIDALQLDVKIETRAGGGVTIFLPGELLFDSGATELKGTAKIELDRLLPLLKSSSGRIAVEGHTDNVPMSDASLPSNWELSANRAGAAVRYLEQSGIARTQLSATGFADTQPIASNDTADGRSSNRRVVFKVAGVNWQQIKQLQPRSIPLREPLTETAPGSVPQPNRVPQLNSQPQLQVQPQPLEEPVQQDDDLLDIDQIDPVLLEQLLQQIERDGG